MVQRTRLLECPNCGKQLEDTKQEKMTCKYCGSNFSREDVTQEEDEYIRRKMVVDLRTSMEIFKARKKYSTIFMIIFFVLALPILFSNPFGAVQGIFLALFFLAGLTMFILFITNDRLYEKSKSQASDLSMRRRM
ncbi:MAG: hypothetical protein ACMUIG_06470 [Thermoplasmatota archaeon]